MSVVAGCPRCSAAWGWGSAQRLQQGHRRTGTMYRAVAVPSGLQ